MKKLVRITTVPMSLEKLLEGQMGYMRGKGMQVTMISSPGPRLDEIVKKEGCPHIPVPMSRSITPLKDLGSLVRLIIIFRKLRPDIVHTHTPKAGLVGMLAARCCRVPIRLHTVAGLPLMEAKGTKRKLLLFTEKLTYICASRVYPNSHKMRAYIEDQKLCSPRKLKVIGAGSSNGIDTTYFSPTQALARAASQIRNDFHIPEDALVFIFIGRIVRDKGIQETVSAFVSLQKEHPHIHLLLVGPFEDDLDPINEACRKEMNNHPSIHIAGYQGDVRPYLMAANVLVFPSYREGWPNVVMQAGCFHLPSIVSNINGCNEIIEDGRNGVIIPAKEVEPLKDAMHLLITDPVYRMKLGQASRERITEHYRKEAIWEALHQEYRLLFTTQQPAHDL